VHHAYTIPVGEEGNGVNHAGADPVRGGEVRARVREHVDVAIPQAATARAVGGGVGAGVGFRVLGVGFRDWGLGAVRLPAAHP